MPSTWARSNGLRFKPDTAQFAATLTALGWPDVDLQTVAGWARLGGLDARDVQSFTMLGQLWA